MVAVMEKPWYRHFYVWLVLAPLIATVIGSFVTLFLAGAPPSLVVDDFGQIAMAIEQDQQRDRRAAELGVSARLQLDPRAAQGGHPVAVSLAGAAPDQIRLELIHPTLDSRDQAVMLSRQGEVYAGVVPLADTRLYVQITDAAGEWRLTGVLERGSGTLQLAPDR